MILVVDTNIVFSAILSPSSVIADILLNSSNSFKFYTPPILADELDRHNEKLKKISGLKQGDEFPETYYLKEG